MNDFAGQAVRNAWERVGYCIETALQEVAMDVGGETFALRVADAAKSKSFLPNADALALIEDSFPGSSEAVLDRMSEINQEMIQQKITELENARTLRLGRAILNGFASFNIFGTPVRKS